MPMVIGIQRGASAATRPVGIAINVSANKMYPPHL